MRARRRARPGRARVQGHVPRRRGRRARPGRSPRAGKPRPARCAGQRSGIAQDRREHGGRRLRVVLGEPLHRRGDAQLPAVAVLFFEAGEGLLGAFGVAEAHQGMDQHGPRHDDEVVRCGKVPGQPLGGPQGGQRVGVMAADQLEQSAEVVDHQRLRGLGFGSDGALGALHPGLRLLKPPLPDQRGSERHVGRAGGRLLGPAVPLGQFDQLPAELRRPPGRPEDLDHGLVRQAGELQVRPPHPPRQHHPLLQVPFCHLQPGRPQFGDAEADQRHSAQLLPQPGLPRPPHWLRCVRSLGHGPQPPRLLCHRRHVAVLTGHLQADHPEQDLHLAAPAVRRRRRSPFCQPEVPLGRLQRPPRRLVSRDDRGQLGIRGAGLGVTPFG